MLYRKQSRANEVPCLVQSQWQDCNGKCKLWTSSFCFAQGSPSMPSNLGNVGCDQTWALYGSPQLTHSLRWSVISKWSRLCMFLWASNDSSMYGHIPMQIQDIFYLAFRKNWSALWRLWSMHPQMVNADWVCPTDPLARSGKKLSPGILRVRWQDSPIKRLQMACTAELWAQLCGVLESSATKKGMMEGKSSQLSLQPSLALIQWPSSKLAGKRIPHKPNFLNRSACKP